LNFVQKCAQVAKFLILTPRQELISQKSASRVAQRATLHWITSALSGRTTGLSCNSRVTVFDMILS